MKSYFGSLSAIDKRSMIASAIRNAKPLKQSYTKEQFDHLDNKEKMNIYGEYMGGMFKGAGPLFQKLLQGLPVGAIPKGLQKAIDDMKDSLAPIPEKIVKERMSAIIENSKGKVKSIDVLKSLGAASVGQAFLCKMYGPAYPEGKEVVIKLLRPDVRNRMVRERKIMEEAAKKVDRESAGIPETDTKYTGGMYANVHGFDEGPGQVYWVGVDIRSFFIRCADYVIKCKNKSTYDHYINMCAEDILHAIRNDPRLDYHYGNDVNVDFKFRWCDNEKHFDVHLGTDSYAEEK